MKKNRIYTFKKFGLIAIMFFVVLLIAGCASQKAADKKIDKIDEFLDKWKTMAENSKGYSPPQKEVDTTTVVEDALKDKRLFSPDGSLYEKVKSLPTNKVKMNLRDAEIRSVLISMARASGQNILIRHDIEGKISVDFNDVPWGQAFKSILRTIGLAYIWEGDIIQIMTKEDIQHDLEMATIMEKRNAQELEVKLVEPLLSSVIRIDYADVNEIKENLEGFLTKDREGNQRGTIKVDYHSHSLVVQAIREDLTKIITLINKIDKPTSQIMIKANIVETTKQTARHLGVQWGGFFKATIGGEDLIITPGSKGGQPGGSGQQGDGGSGGGSGNGSGDGLTGAPENIPKGHRRLLNPLFGVPNRFASNFPVSNEVFDEANASGTVGFIFGSLDGNFLNLQLQALEEDGKLNILSSPSITTLDNQKAYTENGEEVPFLSTASTGGSLQQDVEFKDATLKLEITPHVIGGKFLKMQILVKKDEVDFSRSVAGNPFIIKKETGTVLIIRDGETIVISGLTKHTLAKSTSGVPVLRDIPYLGWLFKGFSKEDLMEEVLIFITPTILPQRVLADARDVTDKPAVDMNLKPLLINEGLEGSIVDESPDKSTGKKPSDVPILTDIPGIPVDQELEDKQGDIEKQPMMEGFVMPDHAEKRDSSDDLKKKDESDIQESIEKPEQIEESVISKGKNKADNPGKQENQTYKIEETE